MNHDVDNCPELTLITESDTYTKDPLYYKSFRNKTNIETCKRLVAEYGLNPSKPNLLYQNKLYD